ncbi:galactonate dehydratase [Kitasatospora gansuensis]|uniref:Galactonate dehydratase n=1 Tax=Kitasatospora gansuensis TaxID=258050 RepID=A0A7W7S8A1_9ACTN|nr:enolase C-terminal domain-like protein [Kitasatospora gansuensis]MBB4945710.1 galactonate dehydratase [Kitasatospora gansuensis]
MITVELASTRVSRRTRWDVVRLRDRDGAIGLGEYSDAGDGAARIWPGVAARLADGMELDAVLAELEHEMVDRFTALTVRGGLEQAATDLAARRAGQPLWRWLGGPAARPVHRYANLNRALRHRTPEEFGEVAAAAWAAGYTALKCAPFDGLPPWERLRGGLDRARAVRLAAPRAELMVDVHGLLTVHQVLAATDELTALGLRWLEDAVALDDQAGLAAVHAAGIAPLAGGEFATEPGQVRPALRGGRLAWLLPDVKHAGGLAAARRLAEEALAAGAGVSLHSPSGPVATAAGLHLAAALGPSVETEFAFGEADWRPSSVRPAESPDGPWITPPDGPGLGLDLDPARWTVTSPFLSHA